MTPRNLPAALAVARDRLLDGVSRSELRQRATDLSQRYRGMARAHARESEVLAYAVTRMPATYAATVAVLDELRARAPELAPVSLLDLGSGPGTAAWAASTVFDTLAEATAIEREPAFRALAGQLAAAHPVLSSMPRLAGDLENPAMITGRFDLVTMGFVLAEMAPETIPALVAAAWAATMQALVILEPGTPDGFVRVMAARAVLIAQGGWIAAPCPHDRPCPLPAGDWCHFSVRLPRERDHRRAKHAAAPFEDEKFAYVVCVRDPAPRCAGRVLRPPRSGKAEVVAALCTSDGLTETRVAARDREAYRKARRWDWGSAVIPG
jgi:ribosomal protein RSM22 (predicted rRNA methylase)